MQSADIYKYTGNRNTNFSIRNSTLLFSTNNRNEYRNSEISFSVQLNSPYTGYPNNEISVRWSIAPHIGDNIVKCFDVAFGIVNGKTRIRYEHQHPEYTDVLAVGGTQGAPVSTAKPIELKFVKIDFFDRSTLFIVSQRIDESGWKELFNFREREHYVDEYPNGTQIAIKVKDYNNDIILSNVSVAEIEPLVYGY